MKLGKMLCLSLAVLFAVISFVTIFQAPMTAEAAEKFIWRLQTISPRGSVETNSAEHFAENVKNASGGRLEIKVYGADEIVPTFESFEAVSRGLLEMHYSDPSYWMGKTNQCSGILAIPFLFRSALDARVFLEQKGAIDVLREVYAEHNIHLVNMFQGGSGSIWTKFPFSNLEDFKGKKIRAYGMWAEAFAAVGVSAVTMPSGEVYEAMERGVVDGLISANVAWCYDYGFHEVSKYVWPTEAINICLLEYAVNMDAWESLPEDLQHILTVCAKEAELEILAQNHEWDAKKLAAAKNDWGIQEQVLDEESIAKLSSAMLVKLEEFSRKDEDFAKLASILKDYMNEIGTMPSK